MLKQGILYVVATPIGNLNDITQRAIDTLQQVDQVVAEDTRHSGKLLQHFAITTPMLAYHDHSDESVLQGLLRRLQAGERLALISDAGTPLISDPGYRLVDAALQAGVQVVPVPGASALIAALSVAGLATDSFCFEGFLPAKSGTRRNALLGLQKEARTLIFYEAPHRLLDTLADMLAVLGQDRVVVLARELTKTFETIKRASLAEMLAWAQADSNQQRGEIVLLLQGAQRQQQIDSEAERILYLLMDALPLKQAAKLAAEITGLKKNLLYQHGLQRTQD